MSNAREQEETLFDAARKLSDPVQRKAFLDAACAENPELRRRLEVLLTAERDADKFFEESGPALNAPVEGAESRTEKEQEGSTVRATLPPDEQPGARIRRGSSIATSSHRTFLSRGTTACLSPKALISAWPRPRKAT